MGKLKVNPEVIIKKADKGKAVVVMDKSFYKTKIFKKLEDRETYKLVDINPDSGILTELGQLICRCEHNFNQTPK